MTGQLGKFKRSPERRHDGRNYGAEAGPHVSKPLFRVQVSQFLPGRSPWIASIGTA